MVLFYLVLLVFPPCFSTSLRSLSLFSAAFRGAKVKLKVLLWVLFIYSIIGVLQQFLGTPFERFFMSILCIVNVVMYFRLTTEKR